jgi:DNA replication initiation complex subunit (GINS family)
MRRGKMTKEERVFYEILLARIESIDAEMNKVLSPDMTAVSDYKATEIKTYSEAMAVLIHAWVAVWRARGPSYP